MSTDRDRLFLADILAHAREIQDFTAEGQQAFFDDRKTQTAVIHNFLVIGEATKQLSEGTRSAYDLPWREMARFRDRLVHQYMHVDLDVVWDAVENEVPPIVAELSAMAE